MPSYNKPSKYQVNCNVKAKVFTGLGAHLGSGNQGNKDNNGVANSQESNFNIEHNQYEEENDDLYIRHNLDNGSGYK